MGDNGEGCSHPMNEGNASSEEWEEMSQYMDDDGNESSGNEMDNLEDVDDEDIGDHDVHEHINIDKEQDILRLDLTGLAHDNMIKFDFGGLEIAYLFYKWYSRLNGFAIRKGRIVKNSRGEILQQVFYCNKNGFRYNRGLTNDNRKRRVNPNTRCGCKAAMCVHVHVESGRWYVKYFEAAHNHGLVDVDFHGYQAAHRSMSHGQQMQMNNYRKSGIRPPKVFGALAHQAGGYSKLDFSQKDMNNIITCQRRAVGDDSQTALNYLECLRLKDPLIFSRHIKDPGKDILHLFWTDGPCQQSYSLFGDVLAFDATYSQNKYRRPVVVFSGVNHHNHSTIFGCGVISNETEDTYMWLLTQFREAMKGKAPSSIITDGDKAMKNAIKRVFPNSYHRLCAWHLLEGAHRKLKNPQFTAELKKYMFGDYEVGQFEKMWKAVVARFGYQDNPWVSDMYENKKMWAACYMRGKYFGGYRTTSRCEGMHSQVGRYVNARTNLTEFIQQFQRCLAYMRSRELRSDFDSIHGGELVLETQLTRLERSAANFLTQELFLVFRPILFRSSLVYVADLRQTTTCTIYKIKRSRPRDKEWHVSMYPLTNEFKCSCMHMESFGLPCEHIVHVLFVLDIDELPECLVLSRWSKGANSGLRAMYNESSMVYDSEMNGRYVSLMEVYMELCKAASKNVSDYNIQYDKGMCDLKVINESSRHEGENENAAVETGGVHLSEHNDDGRTIGKRKRNQQGGGASTSKWAATKRTHKCSFCSVEGHDKRCCPVLDESWLLDFDG